MSTITADMRAERFKNAPKHIQFLYDNPSNGAFLVQVFDAYELPDEQYNTFAILIGDIILGLVPRAKFVPMLMLQLDIDHDKADRIDRSMAQFFAPIEGGVLTNVQPPMLPDPASETRDALILKPRMTEKISERTVPEPGAKPLTREEILHSLAAKRTLATDVSALKQDEPA